jgi:hypothetical protein
VLERRLRWQRSGRCQERSSACAILRPREHAARSPCRDPRSLPLKTGEQDAVQSQMLAVKMSALDLQSGTKPIRISERRAPVRPITTRSVPDADIGSTSPVSKSTLWLVDCAQKRIPHLLVEMIGARSAEPVRPRAVGLNHFAVWQSTA